MGNVSGGRLKETSMRYNRLALITFLAMNLAGCTSSTTTSRQTPSGTTPASPASPGSSSATPASPSAQAAADTYEFTVDGQNYRGPNSGNRSTSAESGKVILGFGGSNTQPPASVLDIQVAPEVGAHSVTTAPLQGGAKVRLVIGQDQTAIQCTADSGVSAQAGAQGTVTLTASTDNNAKGTFSITASCVDFVGANRVNKQVTGSFDASSLSPGQI